MFGTNTGTNNCMLQIPSCLENLLYSNIFSWIQLEEHKQWQPKLLSLLRRLTSTSLSASTSFSFPLQLRRSGKEKLCLSPNPKHTRTPPCITASSSGFQPTAHPSKYVGEKRLRKHKPPFVSSSLRSHLIAVLFEGLPTEKPPMAKSYLLRGGSPQLLQASWHN